MPPRRELNTRFQRHVRRRRAVRTLSAVALCTVVLIGTAFDLAKTTAIGATASAQLPALVSNIVAPARALKMAAAGALASIGRTTSSGLSQTAGAATATASSLADAIGAFIGNIFHPNTLATSEPPPENRNQQRPSQTADATSSD